MGTSETILISVDCTGYLLLCILVASSQESSEMSGVGWRISTAPASRWDLDTIGLEGEDIFRQIKEYLPRFEPYVGIQAG